MRHAPAHSHPDAPSCFLFAVAAALLLLPGPVDDAYAADTSKPNILFAFVDDWGTHAGVFDTEGVQTPTVDRLAKDGVLFKHGFAPVPSCTPSRGAVLTGQHPFRLGPGANLHSTLPKELPVYTWLLHEKAGYHVGHQHKGWGPGRVGAGGRTRSPAGPKYKDFDAFLAKRPDGAPFCFWFGNADPHRNFSSGTEVDPKDVFIPPYLPDTETIREDIAKYLTEVQSFDRELGGVIDRLKKMGELSNTLIVISSDHGWPFPRSKSNLYDAGSRVPLIVHWPEKVAGGRVVDDFANVIDVAPTFLEVAGVDVPDQMTGRSLLKVLRSKASGQVDPERDHVILVKERHHGKCREDNNGYPSRAIRTDRYLYIRNYKPDRWPAGSPYWSSSQGILSDTDGGPTKSWMIEHANQPEVRPLFRLCFDKRPAEELYDVREDPHQLRNLAADEALAETKKKLAARLDTRLKQLLDPRLAGEGDKFDNYPYYTGYGMKKVMPPQSVIKALGLE